MDRRRFVKLGALAGLSFLAPVGTPSSQAKSQNFPGPYYLIVNASGGWDPTFFCDPKSAALVHPSNGKIEKAGNIPYAPVSGMTGTAGEVFYTTTQFFEKWHSRLLVLNGVDTTTNNHDSGTRTTWCGQLGEGYPAFGALAASVALANYEVPLAFLSTGGFDATEGVCSLSRLGNVDAVQKLAYPNVMNPQDADKQFYITSATATRIAAAQSARIQAQRDKQRLPTVKTAMSTLYLARQGNAGLEKLAVELQKTSLIDIDQIPDLRNLDDTGAVGDAVGVMQQAQLALLAFKTGVAVSANINIGGFDTHSNHDEDGARQLLNLLRGLTYVFEQIDKLGLRSKVTVLVGSDFGRTPEYNADNGKDHWNITSMLFSGSEIQGDRVIGATDDGFTPKTINKSGGLDAGGFRMEPKHIHVALRKLAGVKGTEAERLFPLVADEVPLFG